jgi:hypothetical protein
VLDDVERALSGLRHIAPTTPAVARAVALLEATSQTLRADLPQPPRRPRSL